MTKRAHRLPDWEDRLHAHVSAHFERPHVYGEHDCLLFVGATVKALTGKDPARGHRGKYRSQATAVRYLKSLGHDTPESFLDARFEEKPVGFAQRGDIVLVPDLLGETDWNIPGICMGDYALIVGTDGGREGLHRVPRALWLKAWRV